MAGESFILMGVSGSGKTLIGSKVAALLSAKFIDGDDLHPAKNIDKMSQGIPLSDEDRLPWLERLNDASYSLYKKNETGFIVCSSLKKQYRDILRKGSPHVHFLWLDGDYETILARMQRRAGHFMPVALLKSQFEALERPQDDEQDIVRIDINHDIANVTEQCRPGCAGDTTKQNMCERGQRLRSALRMIFKNRLSTPRGNAPYRRAHAGWRR